ncbi:MAG: nucleoside-diphosphate sugar epimerase/dehydratase [Methylococcales bacterium]|nr:nucleoside-diphosphate sugar epimerase/dehydratase [Methylococcales bacterium]
MRFKFRSRLTVFVHDLFMVTLAWSGAYWLRFNLETLPKFFATHLQQDLPYVVLIQGSVFWALGLYRGVWRFSSMPDLIRIAQAALLGLVLITVSFFLYDRMYGVPRAVLPLYLLLLLLLLCIPRFCYRFFKEYVMHERSGKRALIIGAGSAGEMLARDLLRHNDSGYIPVGFLDDNLRKRHSDIRGIRVLGPVDRLDKYIRKLNAEILLIAVPSANDAQMRAIVERCEQSGLPFLTLPSVKNLLSTQILGDKLRDVSIEDILGREPVAMDWELICTRLKGRTVLVTGGGGSIGSELCKQLARVEPGLLVVLDQSEYNLYSIDAELSQQFPQLRHQAILGDVTNARTVHNVLQTFKPQVVFHAAAYKHVPLLEHQAREAVHNNLLGTMRLADAALALKVERFVLISTDKAVQPSSVMGATKRAAEIYCQHLSLQGGTHFMTVRFGNVLDSAGSVVPLFRKQIRQGGPITVTHPDISRYFMTIPEACQLIMKAATIGQGGEIFVLDMGEPIKIRYLAEQMIRLSGKRPGIDIDIQYVGLRPGEKLHETLHHPNEQIEPSGYAKLFKVKARRCQEPRAWLDRVAHLATQLQDLPEQEVIVALQELVTDFTNGQKKAAQEGG